MKIEADYAALTKALAAVVPAASRSSFGMAAVQGCRFDAEGDSLRVTCTDLYKVASATLDATVNEEGNAVVPAVLLSNLLAKASGESVQLVAADQDAHIVVGGFEADLRCYAVADWPRVDSAGETTVVLGEGDVDLILRASIAASRDSARAQLTGLSFEGNVMGCTDSYRAARATLAVAPPEMLPPAESVVAALKAIGPGVVAVGCDAGWATFQREDGSLTWRIRCLDGAFPKMDSFFDLKRPYALEVNREELIAAIGQVRPLVDAGETHPILLDFDGGALTIGSSTVDYGAARATVSASGELPGKICFDVRYLLAAAQVVASETLSLETVDLLKPAAIHDGALHQILMPIRRPSS